MKRQLTRQDWWGIRAVAYGAFMFLMYTARHASWPAGIAVCTFAFVLVYIMVIVDGRNDPIDDDGFHE
jgi:hypothetical protein